MNLSKRLKELLSYNEETGCFTWLVFRNYNADVGDIAGVKHNSRNGKRYIKIKIDGLAYSAHRLVWLYMHGELPKCEIDHIDGNGLNNKLRNLRSVSHVENSKNRRKNSNNTSGVCGVSYEESTRKWRSRISTNGKRINLGAFDFF